MKRKVDLNNKTIVITGVAGFIGFHLTKRLLETNQTIKLIGLDNMNDYYDKSLKDYRLNLLKKFKNFHFIKGTIADKEFVMNTMKKYKPNIVVNLAAQAGVRYSIDHPDVYIESNIVGFYNVLEGCRYHQVEHLIYASSSSVYGDNKKVPFAEEDVVDGPVSLYAATKKSDELLAYSYSKLFDIPSTGLRLFTVYGPAGRPDMALFRFTKKMINQERIQLFKEGNLERDFTYIDDIVEGIIRVMKKAPSKGKKSISPYAIYNIGNSKPVKIRDFVEIIEEELKREGLLPKDYDLEDHIDLLPMQKGDVLKTYADTTLLEKDFGYKPKTPLREGIHEFVKWYKTYYVDKERK